MTTFTTSPAASADDAQESNSTNTINGTSVNANSATQISAVRIPNVTVPPGSTINSAYLTLNLPNATYDDPDVTIRGSGEANPSGFTTTTDHLTDRLKTSAGVAWNAANVGTGNQNTPSLTTLVQEIIAIPGWASGNAMNFYFLGSTGSSFRFYTYDFGSNLPVLTIDYTAPSAGGQPVRTLHQFRLRGL